eukprot:GHVT01020545.1.p1 GENE.GHVT01020545.1~~GHVT01020545.1.p1  ORF type:complete len:182 (-),score=23.15 GHVT01020545.1:463-987(-)
MKPMYKAPDPAVKSNDSKEKNEVSPDTPNPDDALLRYGPPTNLGQRRTPDNDCKRRRLRDNVIVGDPFDDCLEVPSSALTMSPGQSLAVHHQSSISSASHSSSPWETPLICGAVAISAICVGAFLKQKIFGGGKKNYVDQPSLSAANEVADHTYEEDYAHASVQATFSNKSEKL